ncbi:hypothetical protein KFE25_008714 [Diacronema lutheri]|uniref:Histone deacetylase 8 n=1 Tax=Diacronema lutheri TaxID=2081491 RepID=A0A8J5XRD0_DIALT|nr:hypothetical protein KFE25_008714 [Diacronema lutheri]
MAEPGRRVALIHSEEDTPETPERARMVTALITSLGLMPRLACEAAPRASAAELTRYHSREYVALLEELDRDDDDSASGEVDERALERHGLEFDAAAFPGVWAHATTIVGGSLRAAELLAKGESDVAIHWQGGRHHATAERAAGFCFANDVVLAALRLLATFRVVVIIDIDIHHGDGAEDAFRHSPNVLTASLHLREPGFFPGSGALSECGHGRGKHSTVNVPLRRGLSPATFARAFAHVAGMCRGWIGDRSSAVVMVCGADGIRGDPRGGWRLEPASLADAVGVVLDWRLPTLLLGGGGYVQTNAARAWALCTMRALQLPPADGAAQIPPDDEFYERYRDGSFLLHAVAERAGALGLACARADDNSGSHAEQNDDAYLEGVLSTLRARFASLSASPPPAACASRVTLAGVKRRPEGEGHSDKAHVVRPTLT